MANEFKHTDAGKQLTRIEDNAVDRHIADSQLANDMLYCNGAYWIRATPADILTKLSGQAGAAFDWNSQDLSGVGDLTVDNIITAGNVDGIDVSALDAAVVKIADLENPPTEDESGKAPTSEWAYDHDVATTGVHAAGTDHVALFGAASTVVSKVIWKDASERALYDTNRSSNILWTDLDLTAYTSADAKFALIGLGIAVDAVADGDWVVLEVRKNGTTPSFKPRVHVHRSIPVGGELWSFSIVALDAGQVLEYQIISSDWTNGQVDSQLVVVGYIE